MLLDKKAAKMKTELSRVLQDAGYANAAEFFTELFAVREEKRKYAEACMEWQQECINAELHMNNASTETQSKSFYEDSISEMRR